MVSLDMLEFDAFLFADPLFGGIHNVGCNPDVLKFDALSLADSSFGGMDNVGM